MKNSSIAIVRSMLSSSGPFRCVGLFSVCVFVIISFGYVSFGCVTVVLRLCLGYATEVGLGEWESTAVSLHAR